MPLNRVSTRRWSAALLLMLAGWLSGLGSVAAQPQPRLPEIELLAGIHRIRAEVAADHASRSQGLMFRERLGANEGMLFVFERPSAQCFWMRNTRIPLSIAFIDDDGTIVNILDMKPFDESSHCSAKPVRFALEMDQGWFAKRGIKAGAVLSNSQVFSPAKPK